MARRASSLFIVAVFAIGIALPALQQASGLLPRIAVVDNRVLNPFPGVPTTAAAIAAFPERFEAWYGDHMGLRGALINAYRLLTDALLRSPDKVIIGQQDWLYLRRGVREDIRTVPLVRDWCGRFPFSAAELESWTRTIAANQRWLAARGVAYLFVVPPNKMTVIPGHLPDRIRCQRGETRLAQLRRALDERFGIELVNLAPSLSRAARREVPIWYRTDTHWAPRGVAAAYPPLIDRIQSLRPAARRIDAFSHHARGRDLGDLGRMVNGLEIRPDLIQVVSAGAPRSEPAATPFPDQADALHRRSSARRIAGSTRPSALVFHDSFFAGTMNRLLAESFARTVFVHHGLPDIDRALVERAQPDIVIQEMVERNLLHPFFR